MNMCLWFILLKFKFLLKEKEEKFSDKHLYFVTEGMIKIIM